MAKSAVQSKTGWKTHWTHFLSCGKELIVIGDCDIKKRIKKSFFRVSNEGKVCKAK